MDYKIIIILFLIGTIPLFTGVMATDLTIQKDTAADDLLNYTVYTNSYGVDQFWVDNDGFVYSNGTLVTGSSGGSGQNVTTASYIMQQVGTTTTWEIINGTTGLVDYSSTDEESILQSALDTLIHGGIVFIKTPRDKLVLTSGLTISNAGTQIIGESMMGAGAGSIDEGVIISSSTNSINFTTVNARDFTFNNIRFDADGTGQNGLVIDDGRNSNFNKLLFNGAFANAVLINPQTASPSGLYFGKVWIFGAVNGFVLDGPGTGKCATEGYVDFTIIVAWTGKGIWFKGCSDGWHFNKVHLTSPGGTNVDDIAVGNSATCEWCYGASISNLVGTVPDATDDFVHVYSEDLQRDDDYPVIIHTVNVGGAGSCVTLAANAKAPVLQIRGDGGTPCGDRAFHNDSIFIEPWTSYTDTLVTGSLGTLKIPVKTSAGAPNDAQGGNIDGGIVANTNEDAIYLRSGGSWVGVGGTGTTYLETLGNWTGSGCANGAIPKVSGGAWSCGTDDSAGSPSNIHDIGNVTSTGCASGQYLEVSGSGWVCSDGVAGSDTPWSVNHDANDHDLINAGNVTNINTLDVFSGTSVTISSGSVSWSGYTFLSVDTEGAAASDDLDTITAGDNGQIIIVRASNDARTVVIKDVTGNINSDGDCTLDSARDYFVAVFFASQWNGLICANNAT